MEKELEKSSGYKPLRNEKGQILPGYTGNPNGRPSTSFSIRDAIRRYLNNNPEEMLKLIRGFIEKDPQFMWRMMEGEVPKGVMIGVGNLDGTPLTTGQTNILELTNQLNALHASDAPKELNGTQENE